MEDPTTFSYHVLKALRERIELVEQNILEGSTKDFSSYQKLVGELTGLRFCEGEIRDILKKIEVE